MPVYIFLVLALPMENYKNQNYHLTNNIIIPKIKNEKHHTLHKHRFNE